MDKWSKGPVDQWRHYKENGDLSSAFEKTDNQCKYYSRAGTAELKTIFEDREKNAQKNSGLTFFTFTAEKMALAIGQQRSILKIQKPPATFI
jgi:hypothetical protein